MRILRVPALVCVLLLPLLASAPAEAADSTVVVADMAFSPARVSVELGETVTWSFQDAVAHTATSDDGFFTTRPASGGASRSVRFPSAGAFGYHCSFHPTMVGRVNVPMAATGSVSAGWKLRWLSGRDPKGRTYDVQVRRSGGTTWTSFRKATTAGSGRFDPGSGTWRARARTLKDAAKSGWSPAVPLP